MSRSIVMPSKSSSKKGSKSTGQTGGSSSASGASPSSSVVSCPICEDPIDDDVHESIFCSGQCQAYVHRGCGGLSHVAFEAAKGSGPFHCPSCRVNYLSHEVSHLKLDLSDLSSALSSRLASLESKFTSVSEEVASLRPVVNSAAPHVTAHSIPGTSSPQSSLFRSPRHPKVPSPENRKFNLIVSGVPEAPEGQARLSRVNHDFERVSSIFSELLGTVNSPPIRIRDCRRLGRFQSGSEDSRSRLVLVTLDLVLAVDSILSLLAPGLLE